jgi:hypothetical protein
LLAWGFGVTICTSRGYKTINLYFSGGVMQAREIEIVDPTGLPTRPGNAFVKKAKAYASTITRVSSLVSPQQNRGFRSALTQARTELGV